MKGEITGVMTCGYGERYTIEVSELPIFKNIGFNCFIPQNFNEITIEGLSVNHASFDGSDWAKEHEKFQGWVCLRHKGKDRHSFLYPAPSGEHNTYRVEG